MRRMTHRWLSLLLTLALVLTMLPVVPGSVETKAVNATRLYIKDAPGVDAKVVTEDMSVSANGWSWEQETATLTLDGFHGEYIEANGDVKIVLVSENSITIPADATGNVTGITISSGNATIVGNGDEERDSLFVGQTAFTKKPSAVYGIKANGGLTIEDCDVSIAIAGNTSSIDKNSSQRYGTWHNGGDLYVEGNASLDINIAGSTGSYGVSSLLHARSTGSVNIRVYDSDTTDSWVPSYAEGVYGLNASGSGTVTIDVPDGKAITGRLIAKDTCGTIDLKGKVQLGNKSDSLGRTDFYYLAPNKKISRTESGKENVPCCFAYDYFGGTNSGVWLMDGEKKLVTQARIATVAENPLTIVDTTALDIEAREVGDSGSYIYLNGLVSGGTGTYTYSLADGSSLPDYLRIKTYRDNYVGYIEVLTPQKEYPAGTFRILVTDSEQETAYIDINYGAVTVANPVTSVSLDTDEKILSVGETAELEAVLTPEDATISEVTWASSNGNIVSVSNKGVINANSPGVATITVTTVQGGLKDTCKVYVKEAKPEAVAGETHIEDLVPNANYSISGNSVSGNSLTADAYGEIEIIDAWRDKTLDIIKTNAEPKCNSDVQKLYIPDKTAVDIKTVSVLATLQYDESPFDGAPKEPAVTIEGLSQDVDYTVSYKDNIDAGNASVVITGKGNYYGSFSMTFRILPIKMTGIVADAYSGVYDKMGHTFTLSGMPYGAGVTYSETEDGYYSATKPTRVKVGETVVYFKVSLKNYEDFYGTTKITILPILIADQSATLSETNFIYDGKEKLPVLRVGDLTIGTDYTVSYENNVNAGTAKAIATGKGNYGGTLVKTFTIAPASIRGKTVTLSQTTYTADGTAKTPAVTVEGLTKDVDYTVSYANNVNAGTATVTVTGKGNYSGTLTKTFEIKAAESQKPDDQNPSAQEPQKPQKPQKPKAPAKNTTLTESKTGIKYKVTKSGTSGGTVEFKAPKNKKVKKITIPSTVKINGITYKVTSIGKNAFKGCTKMTSVTIGKNVSKIGTKAFYGCKKLKNITIKTTKLKSSTVGKNAFKGTPKSAKVKVPKNSLKSYKKFLYKKGIHKKAKIKK